MENFMEIAFKEAKKAEKCNEVPIGACIVLNGKVISKAHNQREKKQNALCHSEILAIHKACKKLKSWRLENCEIYVTLEPCPMCCGAIANARIKKVIYACKETTSQDNLCEKILSSQRLNHKCEIVQDKAYSQKCSNLLTNFFKSKRKQNVV